MRTRRAFYMFYALHFRHPRIGLALFSFAEHFPETLPAIIACCGGEDVFQIKSRHTVITYCFLVTHEYLTMTSLNSFVCLSASGQLSIDVKPSR
jgi:hypothetical protein